MLRHDLVGIIPPGALGAGFFANLTAGLERVDGRVVFLGESASASVRALREAGVITLQTRTGLRRALAAEDFVRDAPEELAARGEPIPGTILVAVTTDRLTRVIAGMVATAESLRAAHGDRPGQPEFPAFVFCANGIYHGSIRRMLDERLEESVSRARLTPADRRAVNASLMRGVSYQSGSRSGDGPDCVYLPGPSLGTRICGADPERVGAAVSLLRELGGAFDTPEHGDATRAELDKAMMNLVVNSWGVVLSVAENGLVTPLTLGEIAERHPGVVRETVAALVAVGRAMRVYPQDMDIEAAADGLFRDLRAVAGHTSSSVSLVAREAAAGRLRPGLPATDEAYLRPLARYARYADLDLEARYFENLAARLEAAIAAAASFQAPPPAL